MPKIYFIIIVTLLIATNSFSQISDSTSSSEKQHRFEIEVMTIQGNVYWCQFVKSTDSTVTYATKDGDIILRKTDILSAVKKTGSLPNTQKPIQPNNSNKIQVKEYKALPLLIVAIGGGVWSYTLLKDASDQSDAAEVFRILRLTSLQNEAQNKSEQKQLLGIGVGLLSTALFFVAIHPTTRTIEQPVSIIPTTNGISLCIKF